MGDRPFTAAMWLAVFVVSSLLFTLQQIGRVP